MTKGDGRKLSNEDRALWDRVRQSVKPMHADGRRSDDPQPDRKSSEEPNAATAPVPRNQARMHRTGPKRATADPYHPPVSRPKTGAAPALSPLEPRQKKRLARGQRAIDDRLDLHGMRQSSAFHTLIGFLRQAQSRHLKTVLVITGKGSPGDEDIGGFGERGVLRRQVPQWLAREEFRDLVVGFAPASRRHGGDGAFYIRIRRRR